MLLLEKIGKAVQGKLKSTMLKYKNTYINDAISEHIDVCQFIHEFKLLGSISILLCKESRTVQHTIQIFARMW